MIGMTYKEKKSHEKDEYLYNNQFRFDEVLWCTPICSDNFDITQIGDIFLNKDIAPPSHRQYYYEFTFIVSGKGAISTHNFASSGEIGCIYLSRHDEDPTICSDK